MRRSQRNNLTQPNHLELPAYDEIGLVLQGGGALGSYQAGVYEGLAEVGVEPTWISGISIGALNTAIIAGNAPGDRVEALRGFWNTICQPADMFGHVGALVPTVFGLPDVARKWSSMWAATRALTEGQKGFFAPRVPVPIAGLAKKQPNQVSFYDTAALRETLLRYANFDRINDGDVRVSVGAVNVRTGNLVYFDNTKMRLAPEHFMASGALPPGFPAVEIEGEYYWDGGLVSNTPLTEIISESQHKDALVFQVDLWSARGTLPGDLLDVAERAKDIQYSSRTRAITAFVSQNQKHAQLIKELLEHIPEKVRRTHPLMKEAQKAADGGVVNIVHLIYKDKFFEGHYKDYEFSNDTMGEHWTSGLEDIRRSFGNPQWFEIPSRDLGCVTHDVHRYEPAPAASADEERAVQARSEPDDAEAKELTGAG
ncbi:Ferredoxin reductase [Caballeronia glathei]|jgi:NTE family protein|uniref:Membrane protein n=1 Tax=Caballeronia glathei TaxID=60547 RepID=A0A069PJU8_9BURK|nr:MULTISPECIES: patatin-like phospholipase family protein [Burkholderiaceae]KDR40179.1 membrane protein [Caballeronia glathei]TCK34921.1 NTE family protein [Paraburkholderia sp. BL8N3]CDY76871.1 Ferredoxin reductase [Caballeronia glathei]